MKAIHSTSLLVATAALLTLSVPLPAFSQTVDKPMKEHSEEHGQMMDKPMKEQGEEHGQMMGMGHMDKMGDMMDRCMQHPEMMGLTEDQTLKMKPLHNDMQKNHTKFEADRKGAEQGLMKVMEVKNFDLDKATSAVKKIADIKTAHHIDMLKNMKKMRTILTDEQFSKMKNMMSEKMHDKKDK